MDDLTRPFLRSTRPPYRLRPRSAVMLMTADDEPEPGVVERLRRMMRRALSPGA